MNLEVDHKTMEELTSEIEHESKPDQLVDNIMLTIFGATSGSQLLDAELEVEEIQ